MDIEKILKFENRQLKKGDAIYLAFLPEKYVEYNEFIKVFNDGDILFLKRLSIISYVGNIDKDGENIQIKKNKQSKIDSDSKWFPVNLFRPVKVPKLNNVIDWIYDGEFASSENYPDAFKLFKSELEMISNYIIEIFQYTPKLLHFLNSRLNHLYNTNSTEDILKLCKNIILWNEIPAFLLFTKYIKRSRREQFIKVALDLKPEFSTEDVIAYWELNRKAILKVEYKSNEDRLDDYLYPGRNKIKKGSDEDVALDKQIEDILNKERENLIKNNKSYISEINQKIIYENELVIFDVISLDNMDKLLFIFIDKDNKKRYYIEDFYYEFYLSKKTDMIENDYIVDRTTDHKKYSISSFEKLRNIGFAINSNYKNFMKKGSF